MTSFCPFGCRQIPKWMIGVGPRQVSDSLPLLEKSTSQNQFSLLPLLRLVRPPWPLSWAIAALTREHGGWEQACLRTSDEPSRRERKIHRERKRSGGTTGYSLFFGFIRQLSAMPNRHNPYFIVLKLIEKTIRTYNNFTKRKFRKLW